MPHVADHTAAHAAAHPLEGSAASENPSEAAPDLTTQVAAINGMSEPSTLATHVRQPTRGSASSLTPSTGTNSRHSHTKADLPVRGNDDDAAEAVLKLERIRKLKESKQRLRRGTGVEVLRPKFWEDIKKRRARKAEEDDASSSDESLDLRHTLGEVKMAIASLPHYPVMAVKGAASRAINLVGRGDTMLPEREGSPAPSQSDGDPSETGTFSRRRTRRGRLGSRGAAAPSPIPEMRQATAEEELVKPQALRGGFDLGLTTSSATSRGVATDSDLDAVKEEQGQEAAQFRPAAHPVIEEAREEEQRERDTRGPTRPRLTLQGPSEDGTAARKGPIDMSRTSSSRSGPSGEDMSRGASQGSDQLLAATERPHTMTSSASSHSILNGAIHDEPEEDAVETAVYDASSDDEESSGESGSDIDEDLAQQAASLCLEHVGDMSKKEMRRAVREARRQARKQSAAGGRIKRTTAIQDKVSRGLHYASSTSRQQRAYEKYSPNPMARAKPSSNSSTGALDLPTSGPASPRESGEMLSSPLAASPELLGMSTPFRTMTGASVASSTKGSASGSFRARYLHAPRIFSLRRRHGRDEGDVADDADHASPRTEDPEMELERVLGKLAAEQAPEEVKEKYEYDVLYENQRGLLVFGIPKFSSRALLQWDPSPWTGPSGRDSPYTIANAQLPDPSWEWVHEEWLVDMAGDVDEAGWQYSASFGGVWPPHFIRPSAPMPRSGAEGAAKFNQRLKEKQKRRHEKEASREDDGIEAVKRSARARSSKWGGVAGPGSFVRRRKWIRLRRRRPLLAKGGNATTPKTELTTGSGDWSRLVEPSKRGATTLRSDEMGEMSSSSSSSRELDEEDEVSDEDRADADARPSTFLPRHLPGNLHNGAHPLEARLSRRRRRHAKEFTGTVRELKSLLPAIVAKRGSTSSVYSQQPDEKARLWLSEIDARNPFISWRLVKKRLEAEDLAFASATLRARERHFQQRRRRMPSAFMPSDAAPAAISNSGLPIAAESRSLTRDALIEINFRRVLRVMRACKLDRHKHQLWRLWLGVETLSNVVEPPRREDLIDLGLSPAVNGQKDSLSKARSILRAKAQTRWRNTIAAVDPLDVWDVIERRLDSVLMLFEFQGSRASFIRLLLEIHASAHSEHRFRQTDWKIEAGEGLSVHPNAPSVLSPAADHAGLPRLEFFSDLIACAKAVLAASDGAPAELASPDLKATSDLSDMGSPNPSVVNLDGLDRSESPRPPSRPSSPAVRRLSNARPASGSASGESDRAFLRDLLKYTEAVGKRDVISTSAVATHATGNVSGAKSPTAAASAAAGASPLSPTAAQLGVKIPSRESSSLAALTGGVLADLEGAKRLSHAKLLKQKPATTPSKNPPTQRLATLSPSATMTMRKLPSVDGGEDESPQRE